MALPWGRQVPFTSAASGVVFLAVFFDLASWRHELAILAAWALVYLIECLARDTFGLQRHLPLPEVRAAIVAAALLVVAVVADAAHAPRPISIALYVGCYLAAGWTPLWVGLRAALQRRIDVELLMVIAALCAAGTGKTVDGALLFVIFGAARALAAITVDRTHHSVQSLLALAPEHAVKVGPDGGEETVPAASLAPGDEVLVRPGERIGADGEIAAGTSEIDQASITGEPLPVPRVPGDEVFAGTVNGVGTLRVRVTRAGAESAMARIAAQVEQASTDKARSQLVLEQIEQRYSRAVVLATVAIVLVPVVRGSDVRPVLLRAMAFMIVASPCALMLATMPALLAAVATAGRHGVLVKGASAMERLGRTTTLVFDKTGTLTVGAPEIAEVVSFAGEEPDADEVVRLAAAVEQGSEHPLAKAVLAEAAARGLDVPDARNCCAEPGRGVHGEVGARHVRVASPAVVAAVDDCDAMATIHSMEDGGFTVLLVIVNRRIVGALAATDRVRPDAIQAVGVLKTMTKGDPVMVTGDNPAAATRVGSHVGIATTQARMLPADKIDAISALQAEGRNVAYIGDGINDAPALMSADIGVAMGHGADLALESSDIVVVSGDIAALPAMITLSQRAQHVVRQNLAFAAIVVVVLVLVDMVRGLPLPLAVAGHELSTVLVALNGLRLLRAAAWRESRVPQRAAVPVETRRYLIVGTLVIAVTLWAIHQF